VTDDDFLSLLNQTFSSHPHYEPTNSCQSSEANPVPAHSFRCPTNPMGQVFKKKIQDNMLSDDIALSDDNIMLSADNIMLSADNILAENMLSNIFFS
jgi:hypothetical protein